ncbi:MAG: PTS IIA-like nitrogen regulatory protein PtsN [Alphaproteobacteria bacterium]|jgi:PTS system nitrogen regulatory IIA component|nr:PTS IIA-like nitrogen regulatory protein PtsN [Alphaproteobacteria bacterium]
MIDFLSPNGIVPNLRAGSKKQALSEISRRAAEITGVSDRTIFEVLLEREKLGSTGVGRGVAIPHGRLPSLRSVYGVFARLERAIDFDAVDDQPVDLMFLLLAPADAGADHLKALAKVSRLMRDEGLCAKLRGCESAEAIYALLNNNPATVA